MVIGEIVRELEFLDQEDELWIYFYDDETGKEYELVVEEIYHGGLIPTMELRRRKKPYDFREA